MRMPSITVSAPGASLSALIDTETPSRTKLPLVMLVAKSSSFDNSRLAMCTYSWLRRFTAPVRPTVSGFFSPFEPNGDVTLPLVRMYGSPVAWSP